ncbi:hypothetical protein ACU686_21340 [Yinghuangia aomiensis]
MTRRRAAAWSSRRPGRGVRRWPGSSPRCPGLVHGNAALAGGRHRGGVRAPGHRREPPRPDARPDGRRPGTRAPARPVLAPRSRE